MESSIWTGTQTLQLSFENIHNDTNNILSQHTIYVVLPVRNRTVRLNDSAVQTIWELNSNETIQAQQTKLNWPQLIVAAVKG